MAKPKDQTIDIPKLNDDPEYGHAQGLLAAFESKLCEIDRELERHRLEIYLRRRGGKDGRDGQLNERLKILQAAAPADRPPPAAETTDTPPAVARGIELLRGNELARVDRGDQVKDLNRDREIIGEAIAAQGAIVQEIMETKVGQLREHLRESHQAALLRIFRAAQGLAVAVEAESKMRESIVLAGWPQPHILGAPPLPAAWALGVESHHDSQISFYRRSLEALGVL